MAMGAFGRFGPSGPGGYGYYGAQTVLRPDMVPGVSACDSMKAEITLLYLQGKPHKAAAKEQEYKLCMKGGALGKQAEAQAQAAAEAAAAGEELVPTEGGLPGWALPAGLAVVALGLAYKFVL